MLFVVLIVFVVIVLDDVGFLLLFSWGLSVGPPIMLLWKTDENQNLWTIVSWRNHCILGALLLSSKQQEQQQEQQQRQQQQWQQQQQEWQQQR